MEAFKCSQPKLPPKIVQFWLDGEIVMALLSQTENFFQRSLAVDI